MSATTLTALSNRTLSEIGFRSGGKGTHTSRTMMLRELVDVLDWAPRDADAEGYAQAVIEENVTGKRTASNRRLTYQRLSEIYGLDPSLPIFRVLLRLWEVDPASRPLLALQCALARDPLLRATMRTVLGLRPGEELVRQAMLDALAAATEGRLNDAVLDKVARNASSTWAQSGHLEGRVRKIRRQVNATPAAAAYAVWLASMEGLAGESILRSQWAEVLDASPSDMQSLVLRAKQLGLINARIGAGVVDIDASGLDPGFRHV